MCKKHLDENYFQAFTIEQTNMLLTHYIDR